MPARTALCSNVANCKSANHDCAAQAAPAPMPAANGQRRLHRSDARFAAPKLALTAPAKGPSATLNVRPRGPKTSGSPASTCPTQQHHPCCTTMLHPAHDLRGMTACAHSTLAAPPCNSTPCAKHTHAIVLLGAKSSRPLPSPFARRGCGPYG